MPRDMDMETHNEKSAFAVLERNELQAYVLGSVSMVHVDWNQMQHLWTLL